MEKITELLWGLKLIADEAGNIQLFIGKIKTEHI